MDLQGKIEKFNVPEIFQLIASGRRTGTLGLHRHNQSVMVYFQDGNITYAYTPNRRNRLGDRLIARGKIARKELKDVLLYQRQTGDKRRLGAILIEKKLASADDIDEVLREQITDTIYSLMTWDEGVFKFYEGRFPTQEHTVLTLPTESLILEGVRRTDEMLQLMSKLPAFNQPIQIRPVRDGQPVDIRLSADEWNLLALCDGKRTIGRLLSDSGFDPLVSLKILLKLLAAQIVEVVAGEEDGLPDAEWRDIERKLDVLTALLNRFLEKA